MNPEVVIAERLTTLEVLLRNQTVILSELREMPKTCAARGVQLQTVMDANLDNRVQDIEGTMRFQKKWGGLVAATLLTLTTREWLFAGLQWLSQVV